MVEVPSRASSIRGVRGASDEEESDGSSAGSESDDESDDEPRRTFAFPELDAKIRQAVREYGAVFPKLNFSSPRVHLVCACTLMLSCIVDTGL